MSFTKTAFVHGLQRSLITSGAMEPYTSPLQMKIAANLTLRKLALKAEMKGEKAGKEVEELTEGDATEMMTDLVESDRASDETMKAIQELEQYSDATEDAGEAAEELADALADAVVSTNKGSDDEKVAQAIMAVEWLKRASADVAVQPSEQNTSDSQADPRPEGAYNNPPHGPKLDATGADTTEVKAHPGQKAMASSTLAAGADTTEVKAHPGAQKVSQVQSAIDLLRKLAENEANTPPAEQNVSDYQSGNSSPVAPNTEEKFDGKGDGTLHVVDHNAVAQSAPDGEGMINLAYLVQKTAEEVGHFLPQELSSTQKLAALRAMVGLNGQERAAYIGRLQKEAAKKEEKATDLQSDAHERVQDLQIADLRKKVKSAKKSAPHKNVEASSYSEEKKAAEILSRLGLGE